MPNGPRLVTNNSQLGDRNTQERSDVGFYEGPNTQGIRRVFQANDRGLIGPDENYFPTELGAVRIPHQNITRPGIGGGISSSGDPVLADETTFIPAWAIGDPR